ncbi:MAG: hypothetical protein JWP35_4657 [Caulobacter sp.]|nr:hypothetical protein [Caulobacter sp.]
MRDVKFSLGEVAMIIVGQGVLAQVLHDTRDLSVVVLCSLGLGLLLGLVTAVVRK